jgi:RimJ/RimL family protein N-acetyltransferase
MIQFWDNTQEHKDDILNFIHHRPQTYFSGTFSYWIGFLEGEPYAFILSDMLERDQPDLGEIHRAHIPEVGHTIGLDFAIGNPTFLGGGLAAPTLTAFMDFYKSTVDPEVGAFFIDPDKNNPRAMRAYHCGLPHPLLGVRNDDFGLLAHQPG